MLRPDVVLVIGGLVLLGGCAPRRVGTPLPGAPAMAALDLQDDDVYVRVVDVGPGLCAVLRIPGGHAMVYDAGHWDGRHCIAAVRDLITGDINLMIISHSDADHLGDGKRILEEKRVKQTILAGEPRETGSFKDLMDALGKEVKEGGSVHNLQSVDLIFGSTIRLGEATVTLLAGWPRWTDSGPTDSERRNAISVVVRLEYRGGSVLFTGDTVGRRLTDPDDACKDAEKVMVDRAGELPLSADVLIASHHGGNNGSATCFIQAIQPQFVVFSAGHDHQHPTHDAATRFLTHASLESKQLFRSDFGDDEDGTFEWKAGSIEGCSDPAGTMTWRLRSGPMGAWTWITCGRRRGAIRGWGREAGLGRSYQAATRVSALQQCRSRDSTSRRNGCRQTEMLQDARGQGRALEHSEESRPRQPHRGHARVEREGVRRVRPAQPQAGECRRRDRLGSGR